MALKHSGRYAIYYINKGKDRNDTLVDIQSDNHERFWKKLKVADGVDLQNTPTSETGSTITEDLVLQNTVLISISSNATIPLEVSLRGIDDFLASILGTENPDQETKTLAALKATAGTDNHSFVLSNTVFELTGLQYNSDTVTIDSEDRPVLVLTGTTTTFAEDSIFTDDNSVYIKYQGTVYGPYSVHGFTAADTSVNLLLGGNDSLPSVTDTAADLDGNIEISLSNTFDFSEDFYTAGASYLIEEDITTISHSIIFDTDVTGSTVLGSWGKNTNIATPTHSSGLLSFGIETTDDFEGSEILLTSPEKTTDDGLFGVHDSSNVDLQFEFKDTNTTPSSDLLDISLIRFEYQIDGGNQWFGLNQDDLPFHKYGKIGFNTGSRRITFKINEIPFGESDVKATQGKPLTQFRIRIQFAESVTLTNPNNTIDFTDIRVNRIVDKARGDAVANYGVYTLTGTKEANDTDGNTTYQAEFLNPSRKDPATINEGIEIDTEKTYTFQKHHMVNQTGNDIQTVDYYAFESVNSAASESGSTSATAHSIFDNQTINTLDLSMQPDSIFTASLATVGLDVGKTNQSDSVVADTSYIDRSDASSAPLSSAYGEDFILYDYDEVQNGTYTPLAHVTPTALDISISNVVSQANSAFNEGVPIDSARTAIRITGTLTVLNETPTFNADGEATDQGSSLDDYIGAIGEARKFLYGEVHLDSPDGGMKILKLFKIGIESATDGPVSGEDLIPQSHDIVLLGDEQVRLLGVDTIRPTAEVS